MAYLAGILITGVLFFALHYFTEFNKFQKAIVTAALLTLILSATAYNLYSAKQQEKMLEVVKRYNQGKTLHCNGTDVNATTFSLSIGTYTFIGKEGTPEYTQMISVSSCE